MPAKDNYHDCVVHALIKDGWTITDEQFPVRVESRRLWIDIRAIKNNGESIILVEEKKLQSRTVNGGSAGKCIGAIYALCSCT